MLRHAHYLREAVAPSKTSREIHDKFLPILDTYEERRQALGKEFKKHDIFHAGYTMSDKSKAIVSFRALLNGDDTAVTDAEIQILRNGKLGDMLRAEAKKLAVDLERPDIDTIRGIITQLRAHPYKPEVNVKEEAGKGLNKAKAFIGKAADKAGKNAGKAAKAAENYLKKIF